MVEHYDSVMVQCHNNPDADTIASGFAIQTYLREKLNIQAKLVYSGKYRYGSNIEKMVRLLDIELEYIENTNDIPIDLLILVDCQPENSNVTVINHKAIAIIDHHDENESSNLNIIYKNIDNSYTSCSALIWQLLRQTEFDINSNIKLCTSLYYGLYTDSNRFQTNVSHNDEEMRLHLKYDGLIIRELQGSSISRNDLGIISTALGRYRYNSVHRYAITEANKCADNVIGIIVDTMIDADDIDLCLVFCVRDEYVKISIRSCVKDISASDVAEYIASLIPNSSGGGREDKAGCKLDMNGIINTIEYKQWHLSEILSSFIYKNIEQYIS